MLQMITTKKCEDMDNDDHITQYHTHYASVHKVYKIQSE